MRGWRLLFVTAIAAGITVVGTNAPRASASGYNYVQNGGFEDGVAPWASSPSATIDSVGADVIAPASGDASGRITLGNSTATVRQTTREGLMGGVYHLSAQVRLEQLATFVTVEYESTSPTGYSQEFNVVADTDSWTSIERDLMIPDIQTLVVRIRLSGSPGDVVYVDDVRFEGATPATMTPTSSPVPEPSATSSPGATSTRTPNATRTPQATSTPDGAVATTNGDVPISTGLRNADFESGGDDGTPSYWHKYGGTVAFDTRAHTGSGAARLSSATESTKWLYQTVVVDGGGWYEFGAWLLSDDAAVTAAFLRISWYASADGSGEALSTDDSTESLRAPSDQYRFLTTGAVQAPSEARSAKLRIVMTPGSGATMSIIADDASFGAADPPAGEPAETTGAAPSASGSAPQRAVGGSAAEPSGSARRAPLVAGVASSVPARSLVINEVVYDPIASPDQDAEWVELYNSTGSSILLEGWQLADAATTISLPATTVPAYGYVVVAASNSFSSAYPGFDGAFVVLGRRIGNGLGNDGDRLSLIEPSGAIADAVSWGGDTSILNPSIEDAPAGHSIERRAAGGDSDVAADFVDNERPSPGRAIDVAATTSAPGLAPAAERRVEAIATTGGTSLSWLPWALLAGSAAALVAVGAWRVGPVVAGRVRHQS